MRPRRQPGRILPKVKSSQTLEVEGRTLALSNLEKVLYPATGFTKADAIDYYIRISPFLLPHLRNRAITLKRYPDGVEGKFFYEKNCPSHRPDWVKTMAIRVGSSRKTVSYCLIDSLPALVWAANLASLEFHPSLAWVSNPGQPTAMVFDLDPGPSADIVLCSEVALRLREVLGEAKLQAWPKTSGSKGLQLYVRVAPGISFEETKAFSKEAATRLVRERPAEIIARMQRNLRAGKVFIDWSQNDAHKTTICAYSLRARPTPTASTPVTWEEVGRCAREKDRSLLEFTFKETLARTARMGDLFASVVSPDPSSPNERTS